VVRERFGILAYAAHSVGSVQIRNKGTVGGNICNASPSADMAPALIGLGARLKIVGIDNERVINVEDFFKGPGESVLGDGEVVTEVRVPNMDAYTGAVYLKHSLRKAMDLAIVGVAAVIRLSPDKRKYEDARIVLGAVAPVPMRARRAEGILVGKKVDDNLVERAAQEAFSECSPISDLRGSAEYRREMVKVFTRRAIRGALKIAEAS
jgi:carbon-monoxide dehydrogenase medium subunit